MKVPYGETWVEEKASGGVELGYKFTAKELDPETGWYYFGRRYYDAVISRWTSVDPILHKYFPEPADFDDSHDFFWDTLHDKSEKLPGMGGVFNTLNLDLYMYTHQNPVKYVDPDGTNPLRHPAVAKILDGAVKIIEKTKIGQAASRQLDKLGEKFYNACQAGGKWVVENVPKAVEAAKGLTGRRNVIADLINAGNALDRGGLTAAGRALQKHGSRVGSVFPKATGSISNINAQGESVLKGILSNPNVATGIRHHARFGDVLEYTIPNGQGARFSADAKSFIGFIERTVNK